MERPKQPNLASNDADKLDQVSPDIAPEAKYTRELTSKEKRDALLGAGALIFAGVIGYGGFLKPDGYSGLRATGHEFTSRSEAVVEIVKDGLDSAASLVTGLLEAPDGQGGVIPYGLYEGPYATPIVDDPDRDLSINE